jgi:hypothetical protein
MAGLTNPHGQRTYLVAVLHLLVNVWFRWKMRAESCSGMQQLAWMQLFHYLASQSAGRCHEGPYICPNHLWSKLRPLSAET